MSKPSILAILPLLSSCGPIPVPFDNSSSGQLNEPFVTASFDASKCPALDSSGNNNTNDEGNLKRLHSALLNTTIAIRDACSSYDLSLGNYDLLPANATADLGSSNIFTDAALKCIPIAHTIAKQDKMLAMNTIMGHGTLFQLLDNDIINLLKWTRDSITHIDPYLLAKLDTLTYSLDTLACDLHEQFPNNIR